MDVCSSSCSAFIAVIRSNLTLTSRSPKLLGASSINATWTFRDKRGRTLHDRLQECANMHLTDGAKVVLDIRSLTSGDPCQVAAPDGRPASRITVS